MSEQTESASGYVLDTACARKYPRDELLSRAREHTKECALMGHCAESGYVLVGDDGSLYPLDTEATLRVVRALRESRETKGVKLRAVRQMVDGEMQTQHITEI